jgi:predicted  nucleic acid-binding Zn-ribbon protein
MDKVDIINKYRLDIPVSEIESLWNEISLLNSVVRYKEGVYSIVDNICKCKVNLRGMVNQYKSLKYDIKKLEDRIGGIQQSGVDSLKRENKVDSYLETLNSEELRILKRYDYGLNDKISNLELKRFKERQRIADENIIV